MVSLVNVDSQLLKTAEFLEALVRGEFAFLFRLIEGIQIGCVGIDTIGGQRIASRAE